MLKCRSSLRVKCTTYAIDTCVQQNSLTLEKFHGPEGKSGNSGLTAHTHTHTDTKKDDRTCPLYMCVCVREQSNAAEKTLKQNVVYIL